MREFWRKFISKWRKRRLEAFDRKINKAWGAVAGRRYRARFAKATRLHNRRDKYVEKLSRRGHTRKVERKEGFFQSVMVCLFVFVALFPRRSSGVGWNEE